MPDDVQTNETNTSVRRDEILRAAASTFARKGFRGSTTREIAESVSMLSGSLYYYFPSKEAMLTEVVSTYLTDLVAAYEDVVASVTAPSAQIRALIHTSVEVSDRCRDEVAILYQDWNAVKAVDATFDEQWASIESLWSDVISSGMELGDFQPDLDRRLVYRGIMGALSWVPRWYQPTGWASLEDISRTLADMVLTGLEPR